MPPELQASFREASDGRQRLYLLHRPRAGVAVRGAVLYVHPWAEEMNKSRRMAALTARTLAEAGFHVLQIDLLGCGDSAGELADADWERWLADVTEAASWLQQQVPHQAPPTPSTVQTQSIQPAQPTPSVPLWLWGLRAGALLCSAAAARLPKPPHLLLWQPTPQGKTVLQQFLRLKAAAQLADGGGKAILEAARADLTAGRSVEVAGYRLPPALALGLQDATLSPPAVPADMQSPALIWLETSAQADPSLSPAALPALARWQAAGWRVHSACVGGPPFWQTTEIEDAPALSTATVQALLEATA